MAFSGFSGFGVGQTDDNLGATPEDYARYRQQVRNDEKNVAPSRDVSWGQVATAQRQSAEDEVMNQAIADQQKMSQEYDGIMKTSQQNRSKSAMNMKIGAAILMRQAALNGGQVPDESIQKFNRDNGFADGFGVRGGGYMPDGTYKLRMAIPGQDGKPVIQDEVVTPIQQWATMNQFSGVFGDDEREAMRNGLKRKYSDRELDSFVINRPKSSGTSVPGWWLNGGERRQSSIQAFGTDGQGGYSRYDNGKETSFGTRDPDRRNNAENWQMTMQGAASPEMGDNTQGRRYVNKVTGESATVYDGDEGPWTRELDAKNGTSRSRGGLSAKDQIAVENQKHRNAMELENTRQNAMTQRQNANNAARLDIQKTRSALDGLKVQLQEKEKAGDSEGANAIMKKMICIMGGAFDTLTTDKNSELNDTVMTATGGAKRDETIPGEKPNDANADTDKSVSEGGESSNKAKLDIGSAKAALKKKKAKKGDVPGRIVDDRNLILP